MRILYAGDGPVGGAADYLLGVLRFLNARVRHVLPSDTLHPRVIDVGYDAVILSDFPRRRVPQASERAIARHVAGGGGLLMIGGWASFSGPQGGWRGSVTEAMLPVVCRPRDDRVHLPGGALVVRRAAHPILRALSFRHAPVICGVNAVQVKPAARVLLSACPIAAAGSRLSLSPATYPLLAVWANARRRAAALMTDVAPHWCGGLVDWGHRRVRLPVRGSVRIEVGERYVRWLANLMRWLARQG